VRFAKRQQRVELAALHALELLAGRAVVDHAALVDHVLQAVGHPGIGVFAVAAGAAGLLVVGLDVLRQIQVRDETHVGLVDAHAEGDGGDHHDPVLAQEAALMTLAHLGVEPGVVGQGGDALGVEPGRGLLHLLARAAVDDAGLALVLVAQPAQQLALRLVLLDDGVADVGPVEAGDEVSRAGQRQAPDDVVARHRVGRGRQRDARHAGVALGKHRQAQVLLAEVVTPLADAMGFVDRHQRKQAALVQRIEHRQEARRQDPFGRGIQQHQTPCQQLPFDAARVRPVERAVEERGMHAHLLERAHLVLHQGDQRADDQGDAAASAVAHDRRYLVGQALAAAGGHQHQRVAAADHVFDDLALQTAEAVVAEDLAQHARGRAFVGVVAGLSVCQHGGDCRCVLGSAGSASEEGAPGMSTAGNPYAPPTARVEDIHDRDATQPIRLWSARGRIGRLRYIAWSILGSFAIMPVAFVAGLLGAALGETVLYALLGVVYIAYFVFFALLTVQRCHDMDWSGWAALLVLIPLVALIFWFIPGTPGRNRFGAPPPPNPRGMAWIVAIPVLLFVVGIVAAVALPAYQQYVLRAKAAQVR
jgi:uncharacterized membrane protein YhaH (DUF805 family)